MNGKGKEYNGFNDDLLFEGEYLNGKKNGKGKKYNDGYLIYEGEYLNGKRNGKGKEYCFVHLIYEGKYLNGKRNGKSKEYNFDGNLEFEGEFINNNISNGKKYDKEGKIILE